MFMCPMLAAAVRPYKTTGPANNLQNVMRALWEQHVEWTRMAIISAVENIADADLVTKRLLRNPSDFAAVLMPYYGAEKAAGFEKLFREHLVIADQLVKAAKAGNKKAADDAEKHWYENADLIARYLNSINPYWSYSAFRQMLFEHLGMTKNEAVYRISKKYAEDIAEYEKIEKEALMMADAMTDGILRQFGVILNE